MLVATTAVTVAGKTQRLATVKMTAAVSLKTATAGTDLASLTQALAHAGAVATATSTSAQCVA